jgi:hypothetical protein
MDTKIILEIHRIRKSTSTKFDVNRVNTDQDTAIQEQKNY